MWDWWHQIFIFKAQLSGWWDIAIIMSIIQETVDPNILCRHQICKTARFHLKNTVKIWSSDKIHIFAKSDLITFHWWCLLCCQIAFLVAKSNYCTSYWERVHSSDGGYVLRKYKINFTRWGHPRWITSTWSCFRQWKVSVEWRLIGHEYCVDLIEKYKHTQNRSQCLQVVKKR